ncbi:hypothetical protein BURCENBC7_AP5031 [Burkholderia cenocepacia BC7]|nr:hypothetical protein BURCENBC7_AP5031 [Burkholderia cenocepacia BC7]
MDDDRASGRGPDARNDGQHAAGPGREAPFGSIFQGSRSLSGIAARIGRPAPNGRVTLARRARACPCDEPMPATQAGHREIESM